MRVLAYCKWLIANCLRYNWSRQVHRFTGSPQRERHIGNNHSASSRKIPLWDSNCRLERQYKWFLHHVLTVNQRLTNLPANQALNNVLNSSIRLANPVLVVLIDD